MWTKPRLTSDVLVRMAADLVMVNVALAAGLVLRLLLIASQVIDTSQYKAAFTEAFWRNSAVLTPAAIVIFYVFGFYTRGRAYSSRYKMLIITQACALLFLVVGFSEYAFASVHKVPRSAFLFAWSFATVELIVSRIWAKLWEKNLLTEAKTTTSAQKNGRPRILLIGGAGYIGSGLLPKLLDRGYEVRLLDSFIFGHASIVDYLDHPRLQIIREDFRQVDTLVQAMKGIDAVIHLGAIVGDPACALDADLTVEVNLVATRTIAEIAKGNGIRRFIFASTCSVYGASDELLDERSALNPVSLYAKSKIASESVLLKLRSSEFVPVILRFGTIYGLSGRTRFDLVVNLLTAKALVDGEITVFGSDQWRPFLHVEDAGRAVLSALEVSEDRLRPGIFNVGSDEQNLTLGQVGRIINDMVPSAELKITDDNVDRRNYRVSFRRIREWLGFQPKWTVEAGIQQVIDAIQSGKVVDYHNPIYSNVKVLSEEPMKLHKGWAEGMMQGTDAARPTPTGPRRAPQPSIPSVPAPAFGSRT
jgi:nucleoside-diphosphate-sugar epimerase